MGSQFDFCSEFPPKTNICRRLKRNTQQKWLFANFTSEARRPLQLTQSSFRCNYPPPTQFQPDSRPKPPQDPDFSSKLLGFVSDPLFLAGMGAGCSADYLFLPPARARVQAPPCAGAASEDAQRDEFGAIAQLCAFQGCRGGEAGADDWTPVISTLTQLGARLKHLKDGNISQMQLQTKLHDSFVKPYKTLRYFHWGDHKLRLFNKDKFLPDFIW